MKTIHINSIKEIPENYIGLVVCSNGNQMYLLSGRFHRINGPALINTDGYQAYYLNGKLHREDGPAAIYPKINYQSFWLNNKRYEEHWYWFLVLTYIKEGLNIPEDLGKLFRISDE